MNSTKSSVSGATRGRKRIAVQGKTNQILRQVEHTRPDDILGFVHNLAELRTVRGEIISLRDLRYVDTSLIDKLEESAKAATEKESQLCVEFLLRDEALDPYRGRVSEQKKRVPKVLKAAEATEIEEKLDEAGAELEMLIDVVSNLKIDDATHTTKIIDDVSAIYATLNQVKVDLKNRKKELFPHRRSRSVHGPAEAPQPGSYQLP